MAPACLDKNKPWRCRRSPFGDLFEDDGVCLKDETLHSEQITHCMVVKCTAMHKAGWKATLLQQQMDHPVTMCTKVTIKIPCIDAINMHINMNPVSADDMASACTDLNCKGQEAVD